MLSLTALLPLLLLPVSYAQSNPSVPLQIEAIEAHFVAAGIVPSLLELFRPTAVVSASFNAVTATPGQPLTETQVASTPSLTVTPSNSSIDLSGTFTLTMVDAGTVGTDEVIGQTRHWLVNGVTIVDSEVSLTSGVAITEYAGPAPAAGSGPHRYVILLYLQPSTFLAPANLSQPDTGVSVFSLEDYVKTSGLGPIVAGTYFTVEEGAASFSILPTTAIVTSTLPPISPTTTATATVSKPTSTTAITSMASHVSTGASVTIWLSTIVGLFFVHY